MIIKVVLAAAAVVVGVAYAAPAPHPEDAPPIYGPPAPSYPVPHPQPHKEEPPKPYAFEYGVQDDYSGANYGHNENSDGSEVKGTYQVALPDGRTQIVNYVADHYNGFQAQVEYKGEAQYPEHQTYQPAHPAPSYPAPPAPTYPAPDPVYDASAPTYAEEPAPSEYN
ncbi:uncharacterized protein [Panulirus ornatus]|uniref:uncharacterized protein n=1 Tax=Panulirus ornatus TaxID=150431 RepID=UPI003A8B321D